MVLDDETLTSFFLVDFDYSLDTDSAEIKDIHIMKNLDNEMSIILLLSSGEVASYTVQFGSTLFGNAYELLVEDDFNFSTIALLLCLGILVFVK